ncbi:MAG: hypothetical protein WD467_01235 [Candidatus Saccharimonadales bacterium]
MQSGHINISGTLIAGSLQGDGANLTNVNAASLGGNTSSYFTNASNISTGTLSNARLDASVSLLGQSIQNSEVDEDLTISSAGSVADGALSSNVAFLNANNTFSGNNTFQQITATSLLQNGNQVCDASGNCPGGGSGGLQGSGSVGQIAFFDGSDSLTGNSNFHWDNTSSRLGIGTSSPQVALDVYGEASVRSVAPVASALAVKTSSGQDILRVATNSSLSSSGALTTAGLVGASGVVIRDSYAYVASSEADALTIVDVSYIDELAQVGSVSDAVELNGARRVAVSGDYAYVASFHADSVVSIDISDPTTPVKVDTYINNTDLEGASDIAISGNYAYIASHYAGSLTVVDISDPNDLTQVSSFSSANLVGARGVAVNGDYAYVASATAGSLTVIDITNPAALSTVDSIANTDLNGARSVAVSGDYAYVASATAGSLTVIDITNPAAVSQVGTVTSAELTGASEVFFSGGYAYVTSDTTGTLAVVDVVDPAAPTQTGSISDGDLAGASGLFVADSYAYIASSGADALTVVKITNGQTHTSNLLVEGDARVGGDTRLDRDLFVQEDLRVEGNTRLGGRLEIDHTDLSRDALRVTTRANIGTSTSSFITAWGGTSSDSAYSIRQTGDGGYIVVGETNSYGAGSGDWMLSKLNVFGQLEWSTVLGSTSSDIGYSVDLTTDGGYIASGRVNGLGAGSYDLMVIKFTANGAVSWSKTLGGASSESSPSTVKQTSDGGYAISWYSSTFTTGGSNDFNITKLDSNGVSLWTRAIGGSSSDTTNDMDYTSDGGFILTGSTSSYGAGSGDFMTVKLDSNGAHEWTRVIGGTGSETAQSVQQTSDGGYIIGGYTSGYGAGSNDFMLVKLDSDGAHEWTKVAGGTGSDVVQSVQQTSDGGYILGGYTASYGPGNNSFMLIKFNSSGAEEWTRVVGGTSSDQIRSARQTSDGGYVVAGITSSYGTGGSDFMAAKFHGLVNIEGCGDICEDIELEETDISPESITVSPSVGSHSPTNSTVLPTIINPIVPYAAVVSHGETISNYQETTVNAFTIDANANTLIQGGNVGIGTTSPDSKLTVSGNVRAHAFLTDTSADVAEHYATAEPVEPGDIVAFNAEGKLVRATTSVSLAGIISTEPGLVLASKTEGAPLALVGRVPVNVTTENGSIAVGDPITLSETPGVGMKASDPARIVGYALESYSGSDVGSVMVFVKTENYIPQLQQASESVQDSGEQVDFSSLNVSGASTLASLEVTGDVVIGGTLSVSAVRVSMNLSIGGHLLSTGNTPEASSGADLEGGTVSLSGTDVAGTINVVVSESVVETNEYELARIDFSQIYTFPPRVTISARNAAATSLEVYVKSTPAGFMLVTTVPVTAGTEYSFDYHVIGAGFSSPTATE